jgi:hypothetical protein
MVTKTVSRRGTAGTAASAAPGGDPALSMPSATALAAVSEAMPLDLLLEAMRFHYALARDALQAGGSGDGAAAATALDRAADFAKLAAPFLHGKGKAAAETQREGLIIELVDYANIPGLDEEAAAL